MTAVNGVAREKRLVPALERGLKILEALGASRRPQTGAELCRSTGMPRTSVHDLLHTLVALGYAREVDPQVHAFTLGPKVLALGHHYLSALDLTAEADRMVRRLSDETGETVQVAILDGSDALYVAKAESRSDLRLVSAVGKRLPAHLTGVGKALLAYLPEPELDGLFDAARPLPTMTPHSISSLSDLKIALAEIRRTGLAGDYCESNPDVACVAAPIFDHRSVPAAAISISVPVTRWNDDYREHLAGKVLAASAELSATLGATDD